MPTEIVESIVRQCPDTKEFWLSWGGEPLLVPDIAKTVSLVKRINPGAAIGFNTNASLLTEEKAADLIKAGLSEFRVSFDGLFPLGHMAGGLSPMKLFSNLSSLLRLKRQLGADNPEITFAFVAARDSIKDLIDTIHFAKAVEATKFRIVPFWPKDHTQNEQNIFRYKEDVRKIFSSAQSLADRIGIELIFVFMSADMDQSEKSCDFPFRFLGFTIEGNASVCCNFYPLDVNIHEKSIAEIWNSEKAVTLRERLSRHDLPEQCRRCGIIAPTNDIIERPLPPSTKPSWAAIGKHTAKVALDKLNLLETVMRLRGKA
jgi:MoaA/NifB/PqqE/SkfB family radical SAM enzyme